MNIVIVTHTFKDKKPDLLFFCSLISLVSDFDNKKAGVWWQRNGSYTYFSVSGLWPII